MFLPTTQNEMKMLGWDQLDVLLVTGDSYIDSPYIGIAVIGKVLLNAGYRVGVIAQPNFNSETDITRLGEPRLFWGVSGGSIDSMVANYTATLKKRKSDDYTPGGINNRRPDRAVIVYSNLIRRYFKNTVPIVLGGIEASLRRVPHYDYWSDKIRGSILFDAKADILAYGMAENTVLQIADKLAKQAAYQDIPGICYISKEPKSEYVQLPAFEQVVTDKQAFIQMFHDFYQNNDPLTANGLSQAHTGRFLIQNPPTAYESQEELDTIYQLKYELAQHPYYEVMGSVKALETIKYSISTHRGCYGECNFCAIAVHEGRTVRWRSQASIIHQAKSFLDHPDFKGNIIDLGGPTANMYGYECQKKLTKGACADRRCLYPVKCPALKVDHQPEMDLLQKIRQIEGIKKVYVASGVRYDLILADQKNGRRYLRELVNHHISGQMKIAPEHSEDNVLEKMGKPGKSDLLEFKNLFDQMNREANKKQYLTYYFIAAYPGCSEREMFRLKEFTIGQLKAHPEQVQVFTPTPSTYASLMYYTEMDPFTLKPVYVEKNLKKKQIQKDIVTGQTAQNRQAPSKMKRTYPKG